MNSRYLCTNFKETQLMQSIFLYVAACLNEHDNHAMRRLHLRPDQAQRIARMTTADLLHLGIVGGHCIDFDINPSTLDEVFAIIDKNRDQHVLIEDCIKQDAPRAMMTYFFGLPARRFTKLRTTHKLPPTTGRHAQPDEDTERRIYEQWVAQEKPMNARALLDIAKALDLSLRVVWDKVNDLHKEERDRGQPAAPHEIRQAFGTGSRA